MELSAKDVSDLAHPLEGILEHLPGPYFIFSHSHIARAKIEYCTNMIDRVAGIVLR